MKYIVDNDLHIHSYLSSCSDDPEQTPEAILSHAKKYGLKTICLTDHFWDSAVPGASEWYAPQDFSHIKKSKPLPQSEGIRFLFGCEADLDKFRTLGIDKSRFYEFDFIIISTTHFHMTGFTLHDEERASAKNRAKAWVERLDTIFDMDLPFHKIGLAHLACKLIAPERAELLEVLSLIPETEMKRIFTKAAKLGVGIELNSSDMSFSDDEKDIILKPFKIAKECGCKFYFGSDAHHPERLSESIEKFQRAVEELNLTEEDKFII
ncbi:MAG: PHP domain-containing protein [Oscillospiraceae bacterium]|nr:PHP domain-containing protein [Oscillospiraceae bacterium]MBQ7119521.1 PHP domain-containing protein [Oscillospiraceae bacterium]